MYMRLILSLNLKNSKGKYLDFKKLAKSILFCASNLSKFDFNISGVLTWSQQDIYYVYIFFGDHENILHNWEICLVTVLL